MSHPITGLHHVSATSAHLQANVDFYTGVLGLKLVKQTINFDDPTHLHLYYGDESGSPGSLVTFFIYPGMKPGVVGWPQVSALHYTVAPGSLFRWEAKVARAGHALPVTTHTGWLKDPEQLPIFLDDLSEKADYVANRASWEGVDRSPPQPVSQIDDVVLRVREVAPTQEFLEEWFSFHIADDMQLEDVKWLRRGNDAAKLQIDASEESRGRPGAGTVHHVAFRISTGDELEALHAHLTEAGVHVSPIQDRVYFKSIYFREPGGILLEVATDGPGFAIDEDPATLGQKLCLPPWLEPRRPEIEATVPPFRNPNLE